MDKGKKKKVALILSGGAARGYAHIGVIKGLEELGIKPDLVIGTSMGSLVGGFYASGFSADEMERIAGELNSIKIARLFPPRPSIKGIVDGKNVVDFLRNHLGNQKIEDLPVKYAAVAVDLLQNRELVITRGDLVTAIRMSISIPGFFVPVERKESLIVDGGILDNLPVRVTSLFGEEFIKIAVNVLPILEYTIQEVNVDEFEEEEVHEPHHIRVFKFPYRKRREYNVMMILIQSGQLMTSEVIAERIRQSRPDVLINVDTPIGPHEFHKAIPAIESGYKAFLEKKEELIRLFNL